MNPTDTRSTLVEAVSTVDASTIIAIDFAATSSDPTVVDLLRPLGPSRGLYRIDGVEAYAKCGQGTSIPEIAHRGSQEIVGLGLQPSLIVGHCTTSTLALYLWKELGERLETRPGMVLIDPTWVDEALITGSLEDIRSSLDVTGAAATPDISSSAAALCGLRSEVKAKFVADGFDEAEAGVCVELMMERYENWLGLLFATLGTRIPVPDGRILVLLSTDARRRLPKDWPADVTTVEFFESSFKGMLSSTAVRQRLAGFAV
jgi:hypothetical protein